MTNAMEARKLANEFKANEIAKMNEYAALHAEHIGEEIEEAAKKGKTQIEIAIKDDLKNTDMRIRVRTILKNNGYYTEVLHNSILVIW